MPDSQAPATPGHPLGSALDSAPGSALDSAPGSAPDPASHPTPGHIHVHDAHLHNLRHVDVDLPRGRLVAVTGVSGSGKSSLAFGTLHGESQRRYLESVAPFARRLIGSAVDPRVEDVRGMPPTVALEQRTAAGGSRSTVGTVSTLSSSLRMLYSRAGDHPADVLERGSALHGGRLTSDHFSPNTPEGACPTCHGAGVLREPTEESMVPDPSLSIADGAIAAWPGAWLGKNFRDILATLGVDIHRPWRDLDADTRQWILYTDEQPVVTVHPEREPHKAQRTYRGQWRSVTRYLRETLEHTAAESSRRRVLAFFDTRVCPACEGHRLTPDALRVTYLGEPIWALAALPTRRLAERLQERSDHLPRTGGSPEDEAERILLPTLLPALRTLVGLGLGHLSLDRPARSLSTGELQRLRLAAQLRSGLFGVAYVLDEPSAGLHPSEKGVLVELMRRFLDEGNSVLLVEHDMSLVEQADWVVDVGPDAGEGGGRVLFSGPVEALAEVEESRTARYLHLDPPVLRGSAELPVRGGDQILRLRGVRTRTLQGIDVDLPRAALTAITGVSGAGKSTLLTHVLGTVMGERVRTTVADAPEAGDEAPDDATDPALLAGAPDPAEQVRVEAVDGADGLTRLVHITQRPIGRTPRSCLATYTGLFDRVRRLFADTAEARRRGWGVGRFSYNVAEGRCPECAGTGQIEVELLFLPGTYVTCPRCGGSRYAPETLEVTWNGLTIADVLQLTVDEAARVFADEPRVARALGALSRIGLGYLRLGQSATELSGGEAQRIKLATELQRTGRGQSLYLMDEPTVGLHPADIDRLLAELDRLVDSGATVVIAEHDVRVIARADHVIDLGPGAGEDGGRVVAQGTPAQVAADPASVTGPWLRGRD
ncbi:excinuclease ABC subunit UvrA [Brachybacterium sp. EF45031]|uniref:excinuclease ABC subunit UvrA n=1 Tax=Brachybacterium sillae TaxID=2810536 RepID=UPI00217D6F77|nr:excinuclease ABC subunit UvrA [Brachybacterium sillae]MCS6711581.1 excinuclease ABC subunit UvrA [Brachybacterium sillae]